MDLLRLQKQNVGNSGEYYIASRFSALDYTVTITLGRAERYDILALSPLGKLIKVSVKTTQIENAIRFPLSAKDENGESDDFYYAFVKLFNFKKEPDFWIIPSKVVCPIIKASHQKYLNTPGKNQNIRLDSSMRIFPIEISKSQEPFCPTNWNQDVKQYYKNLQYFADSEILN